MSRLLRKAFPWLALALAVSAIGWALSFGTLPPADFTFDNGNEIKSLDPAKATGQPENRIINGLFEGLLRSLPPEGYAEKYGPNDNVPLIPHAAMAELPEISPDGKTYTFTMRPGVQWSDGSPVTADDFVWSWRRTLHPETACEYAYQITNYVAGAAAYNSATVNVDDPVEIELADRLDPLQNFPRGSLVRGKVTNILKPAAIVPPPKASKEAIEKLEAKWKETWVYEVLVESVTPAERPEWCQAKTLARAAEGSSPAAKLVADSVGKTLAFSVAPGADVEVKSGEVSPCLHILPDFAQTVAIQAETPGKLVVKLKSRTTYFSELVAFYPLYPVNRRCVERHGSPTWGKPENLVNNGPFLLKFRRLRDRIRMVKNPKYWEADKVRLNSIDALAIKSETTSLNMYMTGQLDWATVMPPAMIPQIKEKLTTQFPSAPMLTVYMYRLNVTRPGLNNPKVRKALNLAIDKAKICEFVTKAGEAPADSFVPPGLRGYVAASCGKFDVAKAKALLAEAGYPGGRGLPKIEILYNDLDAHRTIAETVQQFWKENLGVETELRGMEWGVFLDLQNKLEYDASRAGWIADYPDPNTFLDMWTSTSQQNQTGWKNPQFDALISQASSEPDPAQRLKILQAAEQLLMDEQPIIPLYHYVSKNLVKPKVKGFFLNVQDVHPLTLLSIDPSPAQKAAP